MMVGPKTWVRLAASAAALTLAACSGVTSRTSPAASAPAETTTSSGFEATPDTLPLASVQVDATPPTTTVSEPTTTTTWPSEVRLPVPDLLPLDPYAPTPERIIGRILIPKLDLDEPLRQGMTLTAINEGPSHWPGTALPGQLGNVVIGGHRTTYGKPFERLDELKAGDEVIYRTDAGTFRYAVEKTEIVEPSALEIADQKPEFTSTLFACHPRGSARYRLVTYLKMLGPDGRPLVVPPLRVLNLDDTLRFRT